MGNCSDVDCIGVGDCVDCCSWMDRVINTSCGGILKLRPEVKWILIGGTYHSYNGMNDLSPARLASSSLFLVLFGVCDDVALLAQRSFVALLLAALRTPAHFHFDVGHLITRYT